MNASTAIILSLGSQRHGPVAAATGGRAKEATTSAVSKDGQATCSPGTAHRTSGKTRMKTNPLSFKPAHCAGDGCTHNHPGDTRVHGVVQFTHRSRA